MRPRSFKLIAGGLVAAIALLAALAVFFSVAILDRERQERSTQAAWPSITPGGPVNATLPVNPPATDFWSPPPLPNQTQPIPTLAPGEQTLPNSHPELGPNPPPCVACHKSIHGVGG